MGDKIRIVAGFLTIDPPHMMRPLSRFIRGDYGLESIIWVEFIILCSLEVVNQLQRQGPDAMFFINKLYGVQCGLRKLNETYKGDSAICYKIAAMKQLIDKFISNY